MRIGRGGGPRGPKGPSGVKGAQGADKAKKAFKVEQVDKTAALDPDEARSALSEAWQRIAEELRDGGIEDRHEAIRRAVHAVIKDRFKGLQGKGVRKIEDQVAKVLDDDPRMADRLADQFRRLADRSSK